MLHSNQSLIERGAKLQESFEKLTRDIESRAEHALEQKSKKNLDLERRYSQLTSKVQSRP